MNNIKAPEKQLLAFVIDNEHDLLNLYMDSNGLDCLLQHLQHLRADLDKGKSEHFHMFSEEWGDGELSISSAGTKPGDGRPIHQLNIHALTDEIVEESGFVRS